MPASTMPYQHRHLSRCFGPGVRGDSKVGRESCAPRSGGDRLAVVLHFQQGASGGTRGRQQRRRGREVLDSWCVSLSAAQESIRKHFADDCVWEQSGFPTTTGPEEAAQLLDGLVKTGFASAIIEFRNVASVGHVVFTERVDWGIRTDGAQIGPVGIVGVTEFRDGKISAWREYFDTAAVAQLANE